VIRWIERSPYLHEARVTTADGADLYAGYVAVTPGAAVWRAYVGRGFVPLGQAPFPVMQRLVAQMVVDIMRNGGSAQQRATLEWDGGGEDGGTGTKSHIDTN